MQQPGSVPTISTLAKPQPPPLPPPRVPPSAVRSPVVPARVGDVSFNCMRWQPRSDRQQPPHLKRRLSSAESSSGFTATRQKLDMPETQTTHPPRPINTQLQPSSATASPRTDRPPGSSNPGDTTKGVPQVTLNDSVRTPTPTQPIDGAPMAAQPMPASPDRESGEMTPRTPLPTSGPSSSGSGPGPGRQPPPHPSGPGPSSPYPSSSSSGNGDAGVARRRDRDVGRLMRELWDTRRQLTAMQAREQVILDDLERLGSRPDGSGSNLVSRDGTCDARRLCSCWPLTKYDVDRAVEGGSRPKGGALKAGECGAGVERCGEGMSRAVCRPGIVPGVHEYIRTLQLRGIPSVGCSSGIALSTKPTGSVYSIHRSSRKCS